MRHVLVIVLLLTGCAGANARVQRGLGLAEKGLAALDIGITAAGEAYASAWEANKAFCRRTLPRDATEEQRDHCTRAFRDADRIAELAARLGERYDEAAVLLDELSRLSAELLGAVEEAKEAPR